jgi:starvation-inducible DNA-binding protein
MNEKLTSALRVLLADNVALKHKSQGYHWNVEGDDFPQFHKFFGKIYENFEGATDTFAEWLRMLKMYAPYRITDFFDISTVTEPILVGDVEPMLKDLYDSVELHIDNLIVAGDLANDAKEYGLANFFAERQTECQKMCWQMRVSMEMGEY